MISLLLLLLHSAKPVICLDPGHPSEVGPGARGKHLTEAGVAWTIAQELKPVLEAGGCTVVLTKSAERTLVTNRTRARIAAEAGADLFLRLHCDSRPDRGFAVYYPASSGKAYGVTGPDVSVRRSSALAAGVLHKELASKLRGLLPDRGLHTDTATEIGARQGALTGSVFAKTPVVLVEMLVITHQQDEAVAASKKQRAKLVSALSHAAKKAVEALRSQQGGARNGVEG
jgi:N-acetylmuramoyl-L-alanine amidase